MEIESIILFVRALGGAARVLPEQIGQDTRHFDVLTRSSEVFRETSHLVIFSGAKVQNNNIEFFVKTFHVSGRKKQLSVFFTSRA